MNDLYGHWEDNESEDESSPFGMVPQGAGNSSILLIVEPGANNLPNAGKVRKEDLTKYLEQRPSRITNHGRNMPHFNLETGNMTDANGAPQGLCYVAGAACRVAHRAKTDSIYYDPRGFGVKTVRVGRWHAAMINFNLSANHTVIWNYLEQFGIKKHARIFEVDVPDNWDWDWDYVFDFRRENEESTTEEEPTESNNPQEAEAA